MTNALTLEASKSYKTEDNLMKALSRLGLDAYTTDEDQTPCRFIPCQNGQGRWTAVFLVTEFFARNQTGGYVGFAARHGFMSV